MQAVIIATGLNANLAALTERHPVPLLPLGDRPFIQHLIESLVERGVTEFDFVLHHLPEKLEHFLGNGARWGCVFRFHLARDAARPYGVLKTLRPQEPLLLAHADRLPQLPEKFTGQAGQSSIALMYCLLGAAPGQLEWTGWAWLTPETCAAAGEELDEAGLTARLQAGETILVPRLLSLCSYEDVLAAHTVLFSKEFSGVSFGAQEVEPGIWISRNVSLHPTARVAAPSYLGENCRIGEGVELGPGAMVGHNCILGARCTVTNSVIFPGSYVGEALELCDVIVDKNLLVNARLGAAIPVADDFILGSLAETQLRAGLGVLWSRLAAIVLLLLTWPVLLVTALILKLARRGPVLIKRPFIGLPAPDSDAQWRTYQLWSFQSETSPATNRWSALFLKFLPALVTIAKGELRFVGVAPRTKEEVKCLSHDWQALYLRAKAGVVTEAEVQYGPQADEDELYSSEAFYSATASRWQDLKLLLAYFSGLFKSSGGAPGKSQKWDAETEA